MNQPTLPPATRRGLLLASVAAATATQPAEAQNLAMVNAMVTQANGGTVGVIAGGVDGTYIRIAADLASVLDDGDALRVLPILGKGSVQNITDIMLLRGIDVGIVQSDALAYARGRRLVPGIDSMIQYIAKLYDEEIHILAHADIRTLQDLAGKTVNIDVPGSGTAMTAALVFGLLGIQPRMAQDTQDVALTRLRQGEIAAMVFIAGKPARLFSGVPAGSGLHFLPIAATPALIETYLPSTLGAADYPGLVPQGKSVETIAVGAVMAVYAWQPGTERHRKVARFVEAFQSRFPAFLQAPRHPKWKEVNLAAQVPGWTRFNAVR
ncbi:TAXI family TRAP transporter solute-binding subunit [Roseomonas aerophila]|uniref:TAXI family TRAP transporter solute-binding subunit n=1 Tax=Teichococcus aerophilus TaxID=1224513 RepID=A0ABR7RIX4_9PROT|nr:TAXI family TRAP transporter solute-binding subunit [Pseudoroseomonas aerophila]MBC9206261.1 TAXI family TRAP transporter solute-binding subunit [Pseudoroseomonas aerophila]